VLDAPNYILQLATAYIYNNNQKNKLEENIKEPHSKFDICDGIAAIDTRLPLLMIFSMPALIITTSIRRVEALLNEHLSMFIKFHINRKTKQNNIQLQLVQLYNPKNSTSNGIKHRPQVRSVTNNPRAKAGEQKPQENIDHNIVILWKECKSSKSNLKSINKNGQNGDDTGDIAVFSSHSDRSCTGGTRFLFWRVVRDRFFA
jgi:hypothetical protein